ncbi:MAG: hypothetical protein OXR73_01370 [Myxococcales bacterium]|nr:hypothetical protein [Myxococcales bacterium]
MPLSSELFGVCRVLRRTNPEADPGIGNGAVVAASAWVGTNRPDPDNAELLEIQSLSHHHWGGHPLVYVIGERLPKEFESLGVIPPTREELRWPCRTLTGWDGLAFERLTQWRWDNEREQLLEEEGIEWDDSDPKRPQGRAGLLWDPRLVNVESPVTPAIAEQIGSKCRYVQFRQPLSVSDHRTLAQVLATRPEVTLRAFGHHQGAADLDFLRFCPELRRFAVDIHGLTSLGGLAYLPDDLVALSIGATRKRQPLELLRRFAGLESLALEGHSKGIHVVEGLRGLRHLMLRSITLPDLSLVGALPELRYFDLKLGGTKVLRGLEGAQKLRYLELWMVKGLSDLTVLGELKSLRYLFLQALKRVRSLSSLARLQALERLDLWEMRGLEDLSNVATAPSLQELTVTDAKQLAPESLKPLVGHPTLAFATLHLGSKKKSEAATELLGLPPVRRDGAVVREALLHEE